MGEHRRALAAAEGKGVSRDSGNGVGSRSWVLESREEGGMAKFWALRRG